MAPIFTVGHSTRSIEELLALLSEPGVEVLVDVRRYPGSRRHPQFSRDALEASLAAAGVGYVHEPDLGGRRPARPGSPHTAWRVEAFRGYADHMETPEFGAALERLIRLGSERVTVILCAEAVPWRCHRRLISDALVARGIEVRHILGPGRADLHELDPNARVMPGGRLVYSGPEGDQGSLFEAP
ncbi:MAG TPA: DUF488 domain-containing protein [Thermoanaerobaculia bacterium]|nr:DUF488 domain-containing protein [Thermoanaerobaculia bacterium]